MAGNLPPGCTDADIDRAANGDEYPIDPPTTEEEHGQAWEYWHERAHKAEAESFRLRSTLREIIGLDHHNHGPESNATKIARAALNAQS